MGASHSRKKKVSSKNVKKENCERREEVQSKGSSSQRYMEEERNGAGDSNVRNDVYNHNFLDYKLESVRKKYASNNDNSTGKDTKQNYPEHFNPFAKDEQYPSSLNPFDEQGNYPSDRNPFEDTDSYNSSSETESKECFSPDEETDSNGDEMDDSGNVIEDSGGFESPEVNSIPERSLTAKEDEKNGSKIKVPDKSEDLIEDSFNTEYKIEDNGSIEIPEVNSIPERSLTAKEDEKNGSEIKVPDKSEDVIKDSYNTEYKIEDNGNIEILKAYPIPESCLITIEADTSSSKVKVEDVLNDLNNTECEAEEDSGSFSNPERNSKPQRTTMATQAEKNKSEVNVIGYSEDALRDLYIPENKDDKVDRSERGSVLAIEMENKSRMNDILKEDFSKNTYNKSNETVNINQTTTLKNYSPSENMKTSIMPAAKRKSYKKYKAPAAPDLPTSLPKIESHSVKEKKSVSEMHVEKKDVVRECNNEKEIAIQLANNNNLVQPSMIIINKKATNNNTSVASSSNADKYSPPPNTSYKIRKQSYNNKNSSNSPANVGLQQGEPKNRYIISRPAPPPPLAQSGKSIQVINDDDTSLTKKIIPVNQRERKTRRKSIWDLFKVKKIKKKSIDMF